MPRIFLDTEFTGFNDARLISIGLAATTGEEFYVEVPYPEPACSPFVRTVVIPLLGKDAHATCSADELRSCLLTWLSLVRPRKENMEICFDFQTDWDLFVEALDSQVPNCTHDLHATYLKR